MGIQSSKTECQDKIQILREIKEEDFDGTVHKLNDLTKRQCKLLISKWDLQLILKLSAIHIKRVMLLLNKGKDIPHANVHHLVVTMLLSTPHMTPSAKIKGISLIQLDNFLLAGIVEAVCFEQEGNQIHVGDIEYLFSVAYYLIHMVSEMQFDNTLAQQQIVKEIITSPNQENVDKEKLFQALESNQEVQNLIQLFSFTVSQQAHKLDMKSYANSVIQASNAVGTIRNIMNMNPHGPKLTPDIHSKNEIITPETHKLNQQKTLIGGGDLSRGMASGNAVPQSFEGQIVIGEGGFNKAESRRASDNGNDDGANKLGGNNQGSGLGGNSRGFQELTTIDLMHSYEPQKTSFSEEVVRIMTQRLKHLKKQNKDNLDAFDDASVNQMISHLNALNISHIDFYGQRQLTQIMKSLFIENNLQTSGYSILANSKEMIRLNMMTQGSLQQMSHGQNLKIEEEKLDSVLNQQIHVQNLSSPQKLSLNKHQSSNHVHQPLETAANNQDLQTQYSQVVEAVNPSKVSMQVKAIFREFNAQYKSVTKYTLNSCFYRIIEHMYFQAETHHKVSLPETEDNQQMIQMLLQNQLSNGSLAQTIQQLFANSKTQIMSSKRKGHKLSLEMKKFQRLGEIGGLSFVLCEVMENDGKVSSDQLFSIAYECYDKLYQSGQSREILVKYIQLKCAKRTTEYWDTYWQGVISKCTSTFQALDCFKEVDSLKKIIDYAVGRQKEVQSLLRDITDHYQQIKRVILDYNYQVGKIRALDFAIMTNRTDKERLVEEIKLRLSHLRDKMEKLDIKLVASLNDQLAIKRNYNLYFKAVGEDCLAKCIQKSLDPSCLVELMIMRLLYLNCWQLFISYLTYEKNETQSPSSAKAESQQPPLVNQRGSQGQVQTQQQKNESSSNSLISQSDKQDLEKVMLHLMKFQKIKELDEKVMQEVKDDGGNSVGGSGSTVQHGFDKFRAFTQRLVEEEEKQSQFFKAMTQQSSATGGVGQPPPQSAVGRQNTFKNAQQMQSSGGAQNPSQTNQSSVSGQSNLKPKFSSKVQGVINFHDFLDNINSIMDNEYTLAASSNKISAFQDFTQYQLKEMHYELANEQIVQKPDYEKHIKLSADFIELNLSSQDNSSNSPQRQITRLIGQHIYLTKLKQDLINPQHVPFLNEKKSVAHTLLEHYLKTLGQSMKSTRYHKQFKETRIEALHQFVSALKVINKLGKWNNFDLTSVTGVRPGNLSMEQCFQTIVVLQQYLREKEREAMWKELVQIKDPQLVLPTPGAGASEHLNANLMTQSHHFNPHEQRAYQFGEVKITEEMEQSQEYKTFNQLFQIMKGITRIKIRTKEKIFKPIVRLTELFTFQAQQQKAVINQLLSQEHRNSLDSWSAVETLLTEQLFAASDIEEDVGILSQGYYKHKQALFDRRKSKAIENYLTGVSNYLQAFNDEVNPDNHSEIISRLQRDIGKMLDQQITENKGLRLSTAVSQFRESSDKLLKQISKKDFLIRLLNKVKKGDNRRLRPTALLSLLVSLKIQNEKGLARLEKLQLYMKSNNLDDQEELILQQQGAKDIHSILSKADFVDEIGKPGASFSQSQSNDHYAGDHGQHNLATQILNSASPSSQVSHFGGPASYQSEEQYIQTRTLQYMTQFVKRMAFLDERLNTLQILRNDQFYGFFHILRQRTIQGMRDKFRLQEQYDEGLRHLVNVFEVYKTPIAHYQKSYERVCRFVQRELVHKVVGLPQSTSLQQVQQPDDDSTYLQFLFFQQISNKGSAIFKAIQNKLELAFGKLEYEESHRLDVEKWKQHCKRELDMQSRAFKEFIDLEENNKVAFVKQQQIEHNNFRLTQEVAGLLLLVRLFYLKLEQEDSSSVYDFEVGDGVSGQSPSGEGFDKGGYKPMSGLRENQNRVKFPSHQSPFANDKNHSMSLQI